MRLSEGETCSYSSVTALCSLSRKYQSVQFSDIKVSAVKPDLHIEIITGGKGAVQWKEIGEGEHFKCRGGGLQKETAVQKCCMQLCAGLRLNKDELVMSNLT